jgi:hypothetical protein
LSNTRHVNGKVPAALGGDGASALEMIGEALALRLGPVLARAVQRVECEPCVVDAARLIRGYQVACANALAAAEDAPDVPELPVVRAAVTWQDGRPVCFEHLTVPDTQ